MNKSEIAYHVHIYKNNYLTNIGILNIDIKLLMINLILNI